MGHSGSLREGLFFDEAIHCGGHFRGVVQREFDIKAEGWQPDMT